MSIKPEFIVIIKIYKNMNIWPKGQHGRDNEVTLSKANWVKL